MATYICKECKRNGVRTEITGRGSLLVHYKEKHPNYVGYQKKTKTIIDGTPIMDSIRGAEKTIKEALRSLEGERDAIQQKLVEYDNLISKYSKLL